MRFARKVLLVTLAISTMLWVVACTKTKTSEPSKDILAVQDVSKIEVAVSSPDKQLRDAVFVPELRGSNFPLGTKVELDEATRKAGQYSATIEANVAGHGRWAIALVRQGSEWLVWATKKLDQAATPQALAEGQLASYRLASNQTTLAQTSVEGCMPGIGNRAPVLFVHGLSGKAESWGREDRPETLLGAVAKQGRTLVDPFSYETTSLQWVDHPNIGPRLAQRISCLAESSRNSGGPGKVIVVAHSMGGLATRFAAAQTVNSRKVSDDIGLVITIGTPNLGSAMGNWAIEVVRDACAGFVPTPFIPASVVTGELCAWAVDFLTAIGGLKIDSDKLKTLPKFPNNIAVQAIAGKVQTTLDVFGFVTGSKDATDLVVHVTSATQGAALNQKGGGSTVIDCKGFIDLPILNEAPCEHGRLLKNVQVHARVLASIGLYVKSLEPKGIPFTFKGLRLWLPESWAVEAPGYISTDKTCNDGMCPGLSLKSGVQRQQIIAGCQPAQKAKDLQAGNKQATLYNCGTAPTSYWDIPSADILIEGHTPELEQILVNAQWN